MPCIDMRKLKAFIRGFTVVICLTGVMLGPHQDYDLIPVSDAKMGEYSKAAVVSNTEPCSGVGRDILAKGGSAVDAIIATLLCEGLCAMQNMGLGGGLFMTVYKKDKGTAYCLDARECAPRKANRDMYQGNGHLSSTGGSSVAVPGELMGYWEAHKRFGVLPWKELFQPAIDMCLNGVPINQRLGKTFAKSGMGEDIIESPTLRTVLAPNGSLPKAGDRLKLPALAETLRIVANNGATALYNGILTDVFVNDIKNLGGLITREELTNYRARWQEPVSTKLGEYTLYTAPVPASGSILAFILKTLHGLVDLHLRSSFQNYFYLAEALKFAYALRSNLGDPQFVNVSETVSKVGSESYVESIRERIRQSRSTSNDAKDYGATYHGTSDSGTINVVVLAPNGDAVAATSTINTLFGSLQASKTTGIILNNEMDDFSSPNIVNSFGLPPSPANFIEAGKRPLSSSAPSIIVGPDKEAKLVVGAAGGTHITTAVSQVTMNYIWFGLTLKQAVDAPRIHHQLQPMTLKYESGIPQPIVKKLARAGHKVKEIRPHSSVTAIAKDGDGKVTAIYDYRRGGSTSGF